MGIDFEHNELALWRKDLEMIFGRPYELIHRQRRRFHAVARTERFGSINVTQLFTENAIEVHGRIMRGSANPFFYVLFVQDGEMQIAPRKELCRIPKSSMMLVNGQSFYRAYQSESFRSLVITIPAALMRTRVSGLNRRCGTVMSSARGSPRVLLDYAQNLLIHADMLSEPLRRRLQDHLLDLIFDAASLLQKSPDHAPCVHTFIRTYLADYDLSPAGAANALGISVRSVHARMARSGTTFGDYMREQRLEQCRLDLLAAENAGVAIAEIAMRWGFVSASTFSHTFHARFGMSPRAYRNHVILDQALTGNMQSF